MNALESLRVPFRWNDCGLVSVRTAAQGFLSWRAPVPLALATLAERLLKPDMHEHFPHDATKNLCPTWFGSRGIDIPESAQLASMLKAACPEYAALPRGSHKDMDIALCREVSFHWDDVLSDNRLYLAWALGMSAPLVFHNQGRVQVLTPGDVIVFDAQTLHALLREGTEKFVSYKDKDYERRFVFALGSVPFGQGLRKQLGVKLDKKAEPPSMWAFKYDTTTGTVEPGRAH